MKQLTFVIEVALHDDEKTFIVRTANGQILKLCKSMDEVAAFLDEFIVQTLTPSQNN